MFTLCNSSCSEFLFMKSQVDILKVPLNSENKPEGLCFLKALFEGLSFGGAYLWREICISKSVGLASLIVGKKFTIFALFYFVFEGNFQVNKPPGVGGWACICIRGDIMGGVLHYEFGELIFGGAYFRNFTVCWFYIS